MAVGGSENAPVSVGLTHFLVSLYNKHTFNKIKRGSMLAPTPLMCEMHSVIIG